MMREYKETNRLWALRFGGLEVDNWRIELRHEHVEFIPLGKGETIVLKYSEIDFKKKFIDITKERAALLEQPFIDSETGTFENLPPIIADSLKIATKEESTMSNGFIKLIRSDLIEQLAKYPNAFTLLFIIAIRARRTDCPITGLKKGEALIGDCHNYGMTQREYRSAKKRLADGQITTIRTTSKGTIAKLCNTTYYDLNLDDEGQAQRQSKDKRRDKPKTTNKKERIKEVKKEVFAIAHTIGCVSISKDFYERMASQHGAKAFDDFLEYMADYCKGNGKAYTDYEATIRNWIRRDGGTLPKARTPLAARSDGPPKGFASYSDLDAIKAKAKKINIIGGEV